MKLKIFLVVLVAAVAGLMVPIFLSAVPPSGKGKPMMKNPQEMIEYGHYLVVTNGCGDCHTPKKMTDKGPMEDPDRLLSGHPADAKLPPVPKDLNPAGWSVATTDLTAWTGPWGISFTRNLTPDMETGIGSWNEETFIKALRTGKDMGVGRDILPPMPWPAIGQLKDDDLKAIFAYLKSIKPIHNPVPDPIPPSAPAHP